MLVPEAPGVSVRSPLPILRKSLMNENAIPLDEHTTQARTDTRTAAVVETGIRMAASHGRYDAARYLIMHRVGFHIVARVLADASARRRSD